MSPICFVLMPYGKKPDKMGRLINFDAVYNELIRPALEGTDLNVKRADEEQVGGFIQKAMFERLILSEFAIADMTVSNANVFYELGVRHTARPGRTLLLSSEGSGIPIDVQGLRFITYSVGRNGKPISVDTTIAAIQTQIQDGEALDLADSPVYQLLHELTPPHMNLNSRLRIEKSAIQTEKLKSQIIGARLNGADALRMVKNSLGDLKTQDSSVVIELFLSYRNLKMYEDQIQIVEEMQPTVAKLPPVQEQLAFALACIKRFRDAENVLKTLLKNRPSSQSFAALGRIYEEQWKENKKNYDDILASGFLNKAVKMYLQGFEFDWRDIYPGLKAVTLMEIAGDWDQKIDKLLPIVSYSLERKLSGDEYDYWDASAKLELSIIERDQSKAREWLVECLTLMDEAWEIQTTANNISRLCKSWEKRKCLEPWITEIMEEMLKRKSDFDHDSRNYVHPRLRERIAKTQTTDSDS